MAEDKNVCYSALKTALEQMLPPELRKGAGLDIDELVEKYETLKKKYALEQAAMDEVTTTEKITEELLLELDRSGTLRKAESYKNFVARVNMYEWVKTKYPNNPIEGIYSFLVGGRGKEEGNMRSVALDQQTLFLDYVSATRKALADDGLDEILASGQLDKQIYQELFEFREGGNPGVSGNAQARKIAQVMYDMQKLAIHRATKAGIPIKEIDSYMVRQTHDLYKLRGIQGWWRTKQGVKEGVFSEWEKDFLNYLDHDRTFKSKGIEADIDKRNIVRTLYDDIVHGFNVSSVDAVLKEERKGMARGFNIRKKFEQEREFFFKDGLAAYEYNKKWGRGNLRESYFASLKMLSNSTALVNKLGTNPKNNLLIVKELMQAKAKEKLATLDPGSFEYNQVSSSVDQLSKNYMNMNMSEKEYAALAFVTGEVNIPVNALAAQIFTDVRGVEVVSKLSTALFAGFSDLTNTGLTARFLGRPVLEGYAESLEGIIKSVVKDTEKSKLTSSLGAVSDQWISSVSTRFSADSSGHGMMSRFVREYFKFNLLAWWADTLREAAIRGIANFMGMSARTSWKELDNQIVHGLKLYGINEQEWELLGKVITKEYDGRDYIIPEKIATLKDEDIVPLLNLEYLKNQLDPEHLKKVQGLREGDLRVKKAKEAEKAMFETESIKLKEKFDTARSKVEKGARGVKSIKSELAKLKGLNLDEQTLAVRSKEIVDKYIAEKHLKLDKKFKSELGKLRVESRRAISDVGIELSPEEIKFITEDVRARALDLIKNTTKREVDNFKLELESKYRGYLYDSSTMASLMPSAREQAFMLGGAQPGTAWGELRRCFFQFKAFPLAILNRIARREMFQQTSRARTVEGLAHLVVMSTLFGYLAITTKDLMKGKTPPPMNVNTLSRALLQGGSLGLLGDFFLNPHMTRYGADYLTSLGGPVLADASTILRSGSSILQGDFDGGFDRLFRAGQGAIPSLFFSKQLFNYLFLYSLQESLNPGYLDRMIDRTEDEGQHYLIDPKRSLDPFNSIY